MSPTTVSFCSFKSAAMESTPERLVSREQKEAQLQQKEAQN